MHKVGLLQSNCYRTDASSRNPSAQVVPGRDPVQKGLLTSVPSHGHHELLSRVTSAVQRGQACVETPGARRAATTILGWAMYLLPADTSVVGGKVCHNVTLRLLICDPDTSPPGMGRAAPWHLSVTGGPRGASSMGFGPGSVLRGEQHPPSACWCVIHPAWLWGGNRRISPACPHGPARASSPAQPLLSKMEQQPGQAMPLATKGTSLPSLTPSGHCRTCCSPRQDGQWPVPWSEPSKGLGATFPGSWASQGHCRQAGEHCAALGGWGRINQGRRSWAAQGPTTRSGWQ